MMKNAETVSVLGVPLAIVSTRDEVSAFLRQALHGGGTTTVFTPNPEILLLARRYPPYQDVLRSADLAVPDGVGLACIARLHSGRRIVRVPGIEIGEMLLRLSRPLKQTVLFLGGRNGSAISAAERMVRRHTDIKIYALGDNVEVTDEGDIPDIKEEKRIRDAILQTKPAVILVGLGAPKQEQWILRHKEQFPSVKVMVGVGGSFDVWSGRFRRAPNWMRALGLEWLWRLMLEPRRLPRILKAVVVFPVLALLERRAKSGSTS